MRIVEHAALLAAYEAEISAAYVELLQSFVFRLDSGVGELRSMAGRCGARCSATHKRCKRGLLFATLELAQSEGLDITPTVAEHLCERLLGRGVDFRAALAAFGTPGRTAAAKSETSADDLAAFEAAVAPQIGVLVVEMNTIRERYREEYDDRAKEAADAAAREG
ncbi:TPA: hypothetical protein ACGCG4_004451 [Enterobacter hormaechei]